MKYLFSSLVLAVIIINTCFAQTGLNFSSTQHNFGKINEAGRTRSTRLSFKNEGNQPLSIKEVKTSTFALSTQLSKYTLAPGDTATIVLTYDPMDRPGVFEEEVAIRLHNESVSHLMVTGEVIPRSAIVRDLLPIYMGSLRFQSTEVSFAAMYHDEVDTFQCTVYNPTSIPLEINWSKSVFPGAFLSTDRKGTQTIPSQDSVHFNLIYDAAKRKDWSHVCDTLIIATNDSKQPGKRLYVTTFIHQRFSTDEAQPLIQLNDSIVDFGTIALGSKQTAEVVIKNTGDAPLVIRKLSNRNTCNCLSILANTDVLQPGEEGKLKITYTAKAAGSNFNRIGILSNDAKNPYQLLNITARVQK